MAWYDSGVGRAGLAIATGGGSEVARGAYGIGKKVYEAGKGVVDDAKDRPGEESALKDYQAEQERYQGLLDSSRDRFQKQAQDYRSALPGLQQSMGEQAAQGGRRELAQNLVQSKKGTSGRGLLYSGLQQGSENQQQGKFYTDLSQKRAQINEQTEGQARGLEDQALNAGIQAQQARLGNAQQAYSTDLQQQLAKQQAKQQSIGSGLGLLGQIGGSLFGPSQAAQPQGPMKPKPLSTAGGGQGGGNYA